LPLRNSSTPTPQESSDNIDSPKPCRTHHSVAHDFYLSYYEESEGKAQNPAEPKGGFVEVIYERLSKFDRILFWDKLCFNKGHSWEKLVINGLRTSKVIILVISQKSLDFIIESANQQKQCNILVEYEVALLLNKLHDIPVYPLLLSKIDYSQFPEKPHVHTKRIQREINELSSSLPHEDKEFLESLSKTMDEISKLLGHTILTRAEDKVELDKLIEDIIEVL